MDANAPKRRKGGTPAPAGGEQRPPVSSPEEIVASGRLSTAEKRRILQRMIEDEMALLVADGEGMQGARPSQIDRVRRALRTLKR